MIFLILNFLRALVVFIKALLNATYEINPIDYSHKTVAHYNTYHTSITEWSILKPLITVLRTWYILPVHYISVQYSHSNSTPYMDTPNCPVMVKWQMDGFSKSELNGTIRAGGTEAVMHSIQPHGIDPIIPSFTGKDWIGHCQSILPCLQIRISWSIPREGLVMTEWPYNTKTSILVE